MRKSNPILIIEDDPEDQELYAEILSTVLKELELSNEMLVFPSLRDALDYLDASQKTPALLIHAMPVRDRSALDLRTKFHENPKYRHLSFPFVILADVVNQQQLQQAYAQGIQGVFEKPANLKSAQKLFSFILGYWTLCRYPL